MKDHHLAEAIELLGVKFHDMIFPHCNDGYWAVIPNDSIETPFISFRTSWKPPAHQRLFAKEMCKVLNAEIGFDGIWAVGWTDYIIPMAAPRRAFFAFFDADIDLQFVVDTDDPIIIMVNNPLSYVHQCAQAFQAYREHVKATEVSADQIIKQALGQKSVDPNDMPEIMPFAYD